MNRKKPEQIVKLLRKADEELAKGKAVEDFCRGEQMIPATYYRWQRKYGNLQVEDAKRLKALEVENAKLKRLLAESLLANDAIREFPGKKSLTAEERHAMIEHMEDKGLSERFACRWSGMSRAVGRYELRRPASDAECLKKMRTAAQANPRYGYRRVAVVSRFSYPNLHSWVEDGQFTKLVEQT
jgi:putative transposase